MNRRNACKLLVGATVLPSISRAAEVWKPRYVLSSAMYGEMPLSVIVPEITKAGCESIDIWCKVHGNQREQIEEMGDPAFAALLKKSDTKLGVSTRYPLGPFKLQDEMAWVKKLGGKVVLCGSGKNGPADPSGEEAKKQVKDFLEKMKPHVAKAEELGVKIALENHSKQMLYHPDSLRYFAEFNQSKNLGIAFAPHHLHAHVNEIPSLIRDLGSDQLPFIYFQEHSAGIREKTAKEIEMQQMPGFGGGLDYRPIVKALADIKHDGLIEIFMHPTPRGIPILPTAAEITAAINKSRAYIDKCIAA